MTRVRVVAAALVAVLSLVGAGCSDDGKDVDGATDGTAPANGGPPAASAEEIAGAARRLASATSFRFDGTAQQSEPGGQAIAQRVQVTFHAPDRLHIKRLALDGSLQLQQWYAGGKVYVQEPPQPDGTESPVRCASATEVAGADPRRLLREVEKVEKATPADTGGSEFDLTPEAAAVAFGPPQEGEYTKVEGRATVVGGVLGLLHVEAMLGTKQLKADFLYADVGSAPPIEVPTVTC